MAPVENKCRMYRVGQKVIPLVHYITLYERYHFLAHPVCIAVEAQKGLYDRFDICFANRILLDLNCLVNMSSFRPIYPDGEILDENSQLTYTPTCTKRLLVTPFGFYQYLWSGKTCLYYHIIDCFMIIKLI